jgi:dTMP kinase
MSGKLIVLEGIDGAGKSTLTKALTEYLKKTGRKVRTLIYPDRSYIYGKIIDDFLHSKINLSVEEQFLLYLTDMVKDKIKISNAIADGEIVILDRYFFSTIAYQCSNGLDYERSKNFVELLSLNRSFGVFYIDIPIELSLQRKQKQKSLTGVDRFEANKSLLQSVKVFYERLFSERAFADNWVKIDGSKSQEEVSKELIDAANKLGI